MEFNIMCSVNYVGATKLIPLNKASKFIDVIGLVCGVWGELCGKNISLSCEVGEVSNILIDSNEDICNLIFICDMKGVRVVNASVIKKNEVNGNGEMGNQLLSNSNYCEGRLLSEDVSVSNNVVVHSAMSTLLSDKWGGLMNGGVGTLYYGDAVEFRLALIKYCSKEGARINYVRNSPGVIYVVCFYNLTEGCKWFIKAKFVVEKKSFLVYSAELNHTCACQKFSKLSSDMLNPRIIAELLIPNVQNKSNMCAKDVVDAMKVGYGFDIPYWKANRAAVIGRDLVYGNHKDSYDSLFYYCKALQHTNPGSAIVFEVDPKSKRFERVFIALKACIQGFKYCVPMIFVDGTFLKGNAEGILLVAIGKDGNHGLFPFAFALMSAENTENWAWFLSNVKACVEHERKVFYFSDRNAGLMAAFPMVFDGNVHFFCLYHLLCNLKARFSGGLSKKDRRTYHRLFKKCAYVLDPEVFTIKIAEFRKLGGQKAMDFLSQLPYEKWAVSFSPVMSRFGEMTSNAAECFNSWLLVARALPITKLFDAIRFGVSRWFVERHSASIHFSGSLVPRRQEEWNCKAVMGMKWKITMCPGGVYEVLSKPSASVDLQSRVCSCSGWQTSGFPCVHAVAVIRKERDCVNNDVEVYFLTETYRACYSGVINPVCDMAVGQQRSKSLTYKILAPILSKPPGRPKSKKRLLSQLEAWRMNLKKKMQEMWLL